MSPVPSFSSLFALCSLPLKQSIHSSSKYFFLTSQEKSIMGRRGEKLGIVARRGQGEKKHQGQVERVKEVCILHCRLYMEEEAAGWYEKEMKSYSFCVFVCTSVSHDYTRLSYKWSCGSAWLGKHTSSTQLYFFFDISCPSSVWVCCGLLYLSWAPIPHPIRGRGTHPPSPSLSHMVKVENGSPFDHKSTLTCDKEQRPRNQQ